MTEAGGAMGADETMGTVEATREASASEADGEHHQRGRKLDRRTRRTRRLIADALIALMLEQRYDRITVQEIIDRADVGRSTFYAHYRDKDDVLTSEFQRVVELLGESHSGHAGDAGRGAIAERGGEPEPLLPSLALFRHLHDQQRLYHALVRGGRIELLYQTGQRALRERVGQRLAALERAGEAFAVPVPVVAGYVAGAFFSLARWWLEHQLPYTPEQMDAYFQRLAMSSIGAARLGHTNVATGSAAPPC